MNKLLTNEYIETDIIKDLIFKINESKFYTNHGPYSKKIEKEISDNFENINFVALSEIYIALLIIIESLNSNKIVVENNDYLELFEKLHEHRELELKKLTRFNKLSFKNFIKNKDEIIFINLSSIVENYDYLIKYKNNKTLNLVILCNDIIKLQKFKSMTENLDKEFNFIYLLTLERSFFSGCFIGCSNNEFNHVLRNYRSSYGTTKTVPVSKTCNARYSEAQAILGLRFLKEKIIS